MDPRRRAYAALMSRVGACRRAEVVAVRPRRAEPALYVVVLAFMLRRHSRFRAIESRQIRYCASARAGCRKLREAGAARLRPLAGTPRRPQPHDTYAKGPRSHGTLSDH